MKNLLKISAILTVFLAFWACQDDEEICAEDTTPRLVVQFYDTSTQKVKTLDSVYVSSNFLGTTTYAYAKASKIYIPLSGAAATDKIKLKLKKNDTSADEITINYTPVEKYQSKGCGFGYTYQGVSSTLTTPAPNVQSITQNLTTIDNESEAHLYIYY